MPGEQDADYIHYTYQKKKKRIFSLTAADVYIYHGYNT